MNVVYAPEPLGNLSGPIIFLAGPTPREDFILSWRPNALEEFKKIGFEGTILVPEDRSGVFRCSYDEQIEWEESGLHIAHCIMFWVPRKLPHMPAFTTNDEWGFWKKSGKVVWGNPPEAERVSYQRYYAKKYDVPIADNLKDACLSSILVAHEAMQRRNSLFDGDAP